MTASGIMAAPVSSTAEPLELWGLLKAVRRFLTRALMSERDHRLLEIFRKLAEDVGRPLLDSRDSAGFSDSMEEAIEGLNLCVLKAEIAKYQALESMTNEALPRPATPWPKELFGGAASRLDAVERLVHEVVKAHHDLMESLPQGAKELALEYAEASTEHPLGFLAQPTLHPKVKEMMLDGVRADVCLMAVLQALLTDRRPEPWLSLALADQIYQGFYQRLRLLASIPGVNVAAAVVPLADRLDFARLEEERKATETWLRELASGTGTDEADPLVHSDG